ncbi:hypothetical protein [Enemella sp. A6]|uniref:hypothetical protein n=1 Tax=Enemella sp. A6 TaxID=3440152 RepID=UPI003EB733E0
MQPQDPFLADWQAAFELTRALAGGFQPQPVPVPFQLDPGEVAFAVLGAQVLRRVGLELAFNDLSQSHAAAGRWEPADRGTLALTPRRVVIGTPRQLVSFGWQGMHRTWAEPDGTVLDYGTNPDGSSRRMKLCTQRPVWLDVMLNFIAFKRLVPRAVPPHLHRVLGVMKF